jgi:DNA primase
VDNYGAIRTIPLITVFGWLGIDTSKFKKRQGKSEHYGVCPYHQPKNNVTSFSFTDDLAHCFACDIKFRGAIDAVKFYKKTGFRETVAWLQERAGSVPAQTPAPAVNSAPEGSAEPAEAILKPFTGKYEKFAKPCAWLTARCPDAAVRDRYGVFYYENNARKSSVNGHVLIPIRDIEGINFGYLARNIGEVTAERPKYRLPANLPKSKFLFGASQVKASQSLPLKVVYVVESWLSVLHFASLGFHAVSPFGWSLSEDQVHVLTKLAKGIQFLPDKNKRPECASVVQLLSTHLWVKLPDYPAEDPEYLSKEQILALH